MAYIEFPQFNYGRQMTFHMTSDHDSTEKPQDDPTWSEGDFAQVPYEDPNQPQQGAYPEPPADWNGASGQNVSPYAHPYNPNGQQPTWSQNPAQLPAPSQDDQQNAYYYPPQNAQGQTGQNPQQNNPFVQGMQMMTSLSAEDAQEFSSARKLVTASQLTALVSLLFGGVVLSAVSIGIAAYGYSKLSKIAAKHEGNQMLQGMIRRPGALALIMAVFALVLNIMSLIAIYPMITEALQQGNLSSLFQSSPTASAPAPSSPGGSLWG